MSMIDSYADGHRRQMMGRIMHGLVTDVDNALGLVTVQVVEASNVQKVELSFSAFSYMGADAATSSWFRYIPQVGSVVLIGYRVHANRLHSVIGDQAGWQVPGVSCPKARGV
jgi:hypothetical protein